MINFKTIIRIIGILLLLETVMFLVCSGVSFYYRESDMLDFWKAGGITAGVGLLLAALGKGGERQLTRRDGYVLVSFAWVAFSLFGMLPFYIGGYIPDIANAFFETMSGFSSTGATILDDIESLPHGILFWRSMTQWIGGFPSSESVACRCSPPRQAALHMTRFIPVSVSPPNGFGVSMPA